MEIAGEYMFDAPRETVWAYLQDPNVLVKVLPGCEELKQIGENAYEGALKVKVGPVQGKFQGTVTMTNIVMPESYDLQVDGRGAPGFVNGSGGLRLEAEGDKTRILYRGQAQVGGRIASVGQRLIDSSAKAIIRQSLDALNSMLQMAAAETAPDSGSPVAAESAASDDDAAAPATADEGTEASTPITSDDCAGPPAGSDTGFQAGVPAESARAPAPPAAAVIPTGYTPPSQGRLAFQVAGDVARDFVPERYYPVVAGAAGGALVLVCYLVLKQLFNGRQ